ncbi:MAG: thiamine-phosphate kinase [Enterovirga sp.]|nr:thiamine-phosphate kinase [Enterovirga sp.]
MDRPGEDELIARYFAPLAGPAGLGLLDDAALLSPPAGCDLVLTADAVVAGSHFFPADPPTSIGRKALGVNLSDLAAKGADPLGFLLTLALPGGWTEAWLGAFCEGLGESASAHGCPLLGGDTVSTSGPLAISITALGAVPPGRMVRRTTARAGDLICVTGTIGDAALGLALSRPERPGWAGGLSAAQRDALVDRYRHPRPRTALAAALREGARAAMDVSDGLTGDLAKMLRAGDVGGVLDLDRVPLSEPARAAMAASDVLDLLVTGGDDYELLMAVPPERLPALAAAAARLGIPLATVGEVRAETGLRQLRGGFAHTAAPRSFSHF